MLIIVVSFDLDLNLILCRAVSLDLAIASRMAVVFMARGGRRRVVLLGGGGRGRDWKYYREEILIKTMYTDGILINDIIIYTILLYIHATVYCNTHRISNLLMQNSQPTGLCQNIAQLKLLCNCLQTCKIINTISISSM